MFRRHLLTHIWSVTLFFSISAIQLGANALRQSPYSWQTGEWGLCVSQECGSTGHQSRSVWCVHSDGWKTHESNCVPSERPDHSRVCLKVCEWQQELFEWQPSSWGPCTPSLPLSTSQCVTAQHGLQRRDVACVWRSNGTAVTPRVCEAFDPSPETEQACLLPCPQDCVVSVFSHWSACSRSCGPAVQQRIRQVLATPLYGGEECPSLTQTRPCNQDNPLCPLDQQEHSYSLWVGPWSPCRLKGTAHSGRTKLDFTVDLSGEKAFKQSFTAQHYSDRHHPHHYHHHENYIGLPASWDIQIGYQTRQLRCIRSDGGRSMLSLCDHDSTPVNFRSCVMPRDCDVSDWSSWSPCSKMCYSTDQTPGSRTRKRTLLRLPIGGGEQCPVLEENQTCNALGELLPPCPRYEWKVTNWSSCLVTPVLSQQDHRQSNASCLCGGGIQTREAYCVQSQTSTTPGQIVRPVGRDLCSGPLLPLVQPCSIHCQPHCFLSPWSAWGACLHDNCLEAQGTKGFRLRTRSIVGILWSEPESCPHVTEAMPCDDPICFKWRVTTQGNCMPHKGACGPGIQDQSAECVSGTGEAVAGTWCPGDPPLSRLPCEVACPGDCVLSDWGPWSPCPHSCSNKLSQSKQHRMRSVLAPPREEGRACPPASALKQRRACVTQPCLVLYWDTSSWGPCTPDKSTYDGNATNPQEKEGTCGVGLQTRQVTCRKVGNGQVTSNRCPESSRPEQTQTCAVPCKTDCIVTPFSEWSPCPSMCSLENATLTRQSRHRIIVQRPAHGGQPCPDTLYEERDCERTHLCPTYRWQTHHWHGCILVPDSVRQAVGGPVESCGLGLKTRVVVCVGVGDVPADVGECVRWAGAMPPQVWPCQVPCRDDCALTPWGRFSPCQGCGSWRTRTRTLSGSSKRRPRCKQEALFPLVEREACPCFDFQLQPQGSWSPCLLPELHEQAGFPLGPGAPSPSQGATQGWRVQWNGRECGEGRRYRAVACLDHEGCLVEPASCGSTGYEEEICHLPCPLDCKLSEWSTWSPCSAPCGGGMKVRSRWLREKPFNGGRLCPKLNLKNQVSEVLPCDTECSQYMWEVEPWSECALTPANTLGSANAWLACGDGVQTRRARCVRRSGDMQGESVDESLCGQEQLPVTTQTCLLPCPHHCVTSPWSQWTPCPVLCDGSVFRWRRRRVLRVPEKGHTCPELSQSQPCTPNSTCLTYSYAYSDWSTCQISENAVCGRGIKTRLLNCVRSDGRLVELSMCEALGPSRGKLQVPCEVGCPLDCLLSAWSRWSECSHTCGSQSQRDRSRLVLQAASEGGQPCPSQLSQTRPCPITPCYSWLLGHWSPCHVEDADCGEGIKDRSVTCVVHWGSLTDQQPPKAVEGSLCERKLGSANQTDLQLPCSLPCPGDCHLTEWSAWSSCQLMCVAGRSFEQWGRQARSRTLVLQLPDTQESCPSQAYQTRPCHEGGCLSYEWRTGGWRGSERAVWCQRSDGLNVTGGCFQQSKPPAVRHCHPPCTKPSSVCTQSGVCGCETGFTEVMTSHGFLDYCMRTPGSDQKKADVKTSKGRLRPGTVWSQHRVRNWTLQPFGPDGRVRLWVYGLMVGGFILILLIITMTFLLCENPKDSAVSSRPPKALAVTYDGDMDM